MSTAPWPVSNRRAHRDARDDHECPSPTVMVVDDDAEDRALFRRWLAGAGYGVVTAGSALEALTKQERCPAAVIMCDVRMPGHNGLWLAERLRDQYPDTAVIMITGAPDLDSAVMSLRNGVADYLSKPLSADHLRDSIRRGYAWHRDVTELRSAGKDAGAGVTIMPSNHASEAMHVESAAALNSMLSMLMIRDADAYEHARRVSAISVDLARSLQVGEPALLTLERAALLHDIGKTALPEAVLLKPCGLTADELALVHRHPQIGYELLCGLWPLLAAPRRSSAPRRSVSTGRGSPLALPGTQSRSGPGSSPSPTCTTP